MTDELEALRARNSILTRQVIEFTKLEQRLVEARRETDVQAKRTHVLNRFALETTGEHDVRRVLAQGLDLVLELFPYERGVAFLKTRGDTSFQVAAWRAAPGLIPRHTAETTPLANLMATTIVHATGPRAFARRPCDATRECAVEALSVFYDGETPRREGDFLALPIGELRQGAAGSTAYFLLQKLPGRMPYLDRLAEKRDYPFLTLLCGQVHVAVENAALLSARDRAKADLVRSESRLRRVLESLPAGVLVMRSGLIDYANAAAGRILGTTPEALVATAFTALTAAPVSSDDGATVSGGLNARLLKRADGSSVPVEENTLALDLDGEPAVVSIIRDLTDERALREQLLQAERLAAVGVLAAGVAHEINNPLTYVMLLMESLATTLKGSQAEDARLALEGALRIRDVVQDLKTFARDDVTEPEPVNLARAMQTALAMAGNELKHRARIVTDLDPTCHVLGTSGRIGQVFLNLLINAAHAMNEGTADSHTLTVTILRVGSEVHVGVRDTGRGVPPGKLGHIFEPFYSTKSNGHGLGLGLAISRTIIERLGGTIAVDSVEGEGTHFLVRLPAIERDAIPTPPRGVERPRTGGRVLVIDDEPSILMVMRHTLKGHDVTTAGSANEAIAVLRESRWFDAIICDLMMPDGGGDVVHAWLGAHRPDLLPRLIVMTGGAFSPRSQAFIESAGVKVIYKPFNTKEVVALVGAMERTDLPGGVSAGAP